MVYSVLNHYPRSEVAVSLRAAFMSKDKLTPAQRGTATHRFMQFADYAAASVDAAQELKRLVAGGMLTETEANAVDIKAVSAFFAGALSILDKHNKMPFTAQVLDKALHFGNVAGALNTTGRGAIDNLPSIETINKYLNK